MKRFGIVLSCMTLFFILGCDKKLTTYDEIRYSEYSKLIENEQDFILYMGSANCNHCLNFKPTLEKIISDYQLDIKYMDVSILSEKEYAIVKNKTKLQGTPTVVFVKGGVVQTSPKIQGEMMYTTAVEKFKESGYIK